MVRTATVATQQNTPNNLTLNTPPHTQTQILRKTDPKRNQMLEAVISRATPKILTWPQYAAAAGNIFGRKVLGYAWPRYVPDYTKCIDHFALHAGGYAVLKGIQKGMSLPMEMMLPSFASLRDYGNTSSSTTWYSMAYMERFGMVKKGQRVMQVGAGGGMKGGVNIWVALRDTRDAHRAWLHCERPYTEEDMPRRISDRAREAGEAAPSAAPVPPSAEACAAARAASAAKVAAAKAAAAAAAAAAPAPAAAAGKAGGARVGGRKSAIERAIEQESLEEARGFGGVVML